MLLPHLQNPCFVELREHPTDGLELKAEIAADILARPTCRSVIALGLAGIENARSQYSVLIDRSPRVQANFLYWRSPEGAWQLIGATPVATGLAGSFVAAAPRRRV